MEKTEFKSLVETSFLPQKEKDLLLALLSQPHFNQDEFVKELNQKLCDEIKLRADNYTSAIQGFDKKAYEFERQFEAKKQVLDSKIDVAVEANPDTPNSLWDEYYSALDKIQQEHLKNLRTLAVV